VHTFNRNILLEFDTLQDIASFVLCHLDVLLPPFQNDMYVLFLVDSFQCNM
jgi:hypothetical protein